MCSVFLIILLFSLIIYDTEFTGYVLHGDGGWSFRVRDTLNLKAYGRLTFLDVSDN